MKYIRTKDGILKIIKNEDFDEQEKKKIPANCTMVYSLNIFGCTCVDNNNIIKQADTIPELCDEFVYHLKSGGKFIDDKLTKSNIYENVFGAIWTDKGLIYVAKMNDKGELELL